MSYYFAIIGTKDNPIFEHEFGTSKQGGDGQSHFRDEARQMNQFIVHSSLDIVDDVQWTTGAMYLKSIDRFYNNYISCFLTASTARFLLLHNPDPTATHNAHLYPLANLQPSAANNPTGNTHPPPFPPSPASSTTPVTTLTEKRSAFGAAFGGVAGGGTGTTINSVANNPTSPAAEEAVRQFFAEVYEGWVKTVMSPFYTVDMPVTSRVFRGKVAAAGRKWL